MNAGKLGLVVEGALEEVADHRTVSTEQTRYGEFECTHQLDVEGDSQVHLGHEGSAPAEGEALMQSTTEYTDIVGQEDGIHHLEAMRVDTAHTEFVAASATDAHDGFAVTKTGEGIFVFDYLAQMQPAPCRITPAEIDLEGFYHDHPDAIYHRYGWESPGAIGTGVTWSDGDVRTDENLEEMFAGDAPHPTQLGLTYAEELTRLVVCESGYVEVYAPSEMESSEFVSLLERDILPHANPVAQ